MCNTPVFDLYLVQHELDRRSRTPRVPIYSGKEINYQELMLLEIQEPSLQIISVQIHNRHPSSAAMIFSMFARNTPICSSV